MKAALRRASIHRLTTWLRDATRNVPAIVSGMLALCLVADALERYLALRAVPATPVPENVVPVPQSTPSFSLPGILAAHLFGASMQSGDSNAAEANGLSAHLTGTIAIDGAPDHGLAMFEGLDHVQHLIAVGGLVQEQHILVAVYPDHVEFDHLGMREALAMPKRHLSTASRGMVAMEQKRPETPEQELEHAAGTHSRFFRPADSDNPGVFKGVEIADGAEAAGLESLGLHTGDKVVTINGVRVTSPDSLSELNSGGMVALGIQNQGAYHVVHVDSALLR